MFGRWSVCVVRMTFVLILNVRSGAGWADDVSHIVSYISSSQSALQRRISCQFLLFPTYCWSLLRPCTTRNVVCVYIAILFLRGANVWLTWHSMVRGAHDVLKLCVEFNIDFLGREWASFLRRLKSYRKQHDIFGVYVNLQWKFATGFFALRRLYPFTGRRGMIRVDVHFIFGSMRVVPQLISEILHLSLKRFKILPHRLVRILRVRSRYRVGGPAVLDLGTWGLDGHTTFSPLDRNMRIELAVLDAKFTTENVFLVKRMVGYNISVAKRILRFLCEPKALLYFDIGEVVDFVRYAMFAVTLADRRIHVCFDEDDFDEDDYVNSDTMGPPAMSFYVMARRRRSRVLSANRLRSLLSSPDMCCPDP